MKVASTIILISTFLAAVANASCLELLRKILQFGGDDIIKTRKLSVAYPDIPSVYKLHLSSQSPQKIIPNTELSPGLSDPFLEEIRDLKLVDDFKPLSDLQRISMEQAEYDRVLKQAQQKARLDDGTIDRAVYLKELLDRLYRSSRDLVVTQDPDAIKKWKLPNNSKYAEAFNYTEEYLSTLVRKTPTETDGSLLLLPYDFLVPNSTRFDELYYWDSYFGIKGLLSTERLDLAQKQVDNFLHLIRQYGFIPNGTRDYYLTRSQPPFISSMVREVFEKTPESAESLSWLESRAYPLLKRDMLDYWMDSSTRFDEDTFLHHHWDDLNVARPERHSADKELADSLTDRHGLGMTYRDTRAVAESGLDFTESLTKEASSVANVLLNSMIYKYLKDLEWMARKLDLADDVALFKDLAQKKKAAMDRYLWNASKGVYLNYSLKNKIQIDILTADTFAPLFAEAANTAQAQKVVSNMGQLEAKGGLMSSLALDSPHQWDGVNGWAPQQMIAMEGLTRYGFNDDAKRLGGKWLDTINGSYARDGLFYERYDVTTGLKPIDQGDKYPTQSGFLWTNSSFVWIIENILSIPLQKASP